jgi:hypothetical protein
MRLSRAVSLRAATASAAPELDDALSRPAPDAPWAMATAVRSAAAQSATMSARSFT